MARKKCILVFRSVNEVFEFESIKALEEFAEKKNLTDLERDSTSETETFYA